MNELGLHATFEDLDYQELTDPDERIRIAPGKVSVTQRIVGRGGIAGPVAAERLGIARGRARATSHGPLSDPFDFSFSSFGQPSVSRND